MALWISPDALASRLGGKARSSGWMGGASISFALQAQPAVLDLSKMLMQDAYQYSGSRGKLATELNVDLAGLSPGSLKISQRGAGDFFSRIFRRAPYRVGDALFDELYVVRSEPEALADRLFSTPRRGAVIGAVRRIGTYVDPLIDLSLTRLRVQVSENLEHERGVYNLIETATDFVSALLQLRVPEEMTWEAVTLEQGGRCPVCNTPLQDPLVTCAACRTPHHQDCWTYLGKCSLFGCSETKASGPPAS